MATAIKKCRVCGKAYEACHTLRQNSGVFRWQDVACSPECGSIYLAKIEESRKTDHTQKTKSTKKAKKISTFEPVDSIETNDTDGDPFEDSRELDEYFDDVE